MQKINLQQLFLLLVNVSMKSHITFSINKEFNNWGFTSKKIGSNAFEYVSFSSNLTEIRSFAFQEVSSFLIP